MSQDHPPDEPQTELPGTRPDGRSDGRPDERPDELARRVPLAFSFAALVLLTHDVLQLIASALLKSPGTTDRWGDFELRKAGWNLLLRATGLAVYPLLLAGAFELLRTTSGPARRGAKLAVVASAVAAAASLVLEGLQIYSADAMGRLELLTTIWRAAFDVRQAAWLAFTAGLCWGAAGARAARPLGWLALAACVAAHPLSPLLERMSRWLSQHDRFPTYTLATSLLYVIALALWLERRPQPARPDEALGDGSWARTSRAVARQHRALAAMFWVALLSVSATMLVYLSERGPEGTTLLHKAWALGLPSLRLCATAVMIAALGRAAATELAGAPRRRLYAAAALYAVVAGICALQLAPRALAFPEPPLESRVLPLLLPALAGAATILLAWSSRGLADLLGSAALRARATTTLFVVGGCQLAVVSVYARLHYATGLSLGASVTHTLVGLLLSTGGLLSLVRTSSALAEELSTRVDLPAAVLRR